MIISYFNKCIRNLWLIALIISVSFNAVGQHDNDTIPEFKELSIDGGYMPDAKPQLNQRIDGSTELIIVHPSNSSLLEETICTDLHDYFLGLGIPVSYQYEYFNKEEVPGRRNMIKGDCSQLDFDFVKNSNTLVMVPNYIWGLTGYGNRLDIHLSIYDIAGGNYWSVILDELSLNSGKLKINKLIKKLQKQVTQAYNYNSDFSVFPFRVKYSWGTREFMKYSDTSLRNMIEGIYDVDGERLGVHIDNAGLCYIIYLSGGDNNWEEGDLKGLLEPSSTKNLYKGFLYDKHHIEQSVTAVFEPGLISFSIDDAESKSFIKMYPQTAIPGNSEIKTRTGTGFALKQGYIVTNFHVIDNATKIVIHGINGDFNAIFEASVIGVDKNNDLALLKINDSSFNGFGNIPYSVSSNTSEVGEEVYVLGFPMTSSMGNEIKLTNGIISSKTGFKGDVSLYQISAPIQPGNSGGPLFDNKGNIIGIINAKHSDAENVSYAIKSSYLRNLVESCVNANILPNNNLVSTLPLSGKVKLDRNFVFLIECSFANK